MRVHTVAWFDRECCDRLRPTQDGVNVVKGVVPTQIVKTEDSRLNVTFSDRSSDVFDTVLAAVGRTADTKSLNLQGAGVMLHSEHGGKIDCVSGEPMWRTFTQWGTWCMVFRS